MLRSEIREEIFKILFREPFMNEEDMEEQISFSLEELAGKSDDNISHIREKSHAILERIEEIDKCIEDNCEGWNIERIGKAEKTIMRIAVYEILYDSDVPEKVAINEAVELAKSYCDEDAKGFVNAILGKVVKAKE